MKVYSVLIVCLMACSIVLAGDRVILESEQYDDWTLEFSEDSWGDQKRLVLRGPGLTISYDIAERMSSGRRSVNYRFPQTRSYWPHCEKVNLMVRVDGGEPYRVSGGGSRGGRCEPHYFGNDHRDLLLSGKILEARIGFPESGTKRIEVSLSGFRDAWERASELIGYPIPTAEEYIDAMINER